MTVKKKVDVNYLIRAWTKGEKKNHEMIYVCNIVVQARSLYREESTEEYVD